VRPNLPEAQFVPLERSASPVVAGPLTRLLE